MAYTPLAFSVASWSSPITIVQSDLIKNADDAFNAIISTDPNSVKSWLNTSLNTGLSAYLSSELVKVYNETNVSAVAAAGSASAASTSATNAASSASSAGSSASSASTSATNASSSASAASTSETNSASSASAASTSATTATTQAGIATTKAGEAASSASSASTSASNASTSQTNASNSAASALASLNEFKGRYYGDYATDPTTDPLGGALNQGDIYFNTTASPKRFKVFNGVVWADAVSGYTMSETDSLISGKFIKPHQGAPLFSKASVSTITIPIGTKVLVNTTLITVSGTAYTLSLNSVAVGALDTGAKAAGTDYYVYALEAGGFILSANATNPTGYTTANSRKIGGFHYGVIPEAFTAINNITSADATKIAGINQYSFWDLKFRPICDPSGMAYIFGRWYDLYLCNVDHHTYGTSAAGKTIAGGTVLNGRNFPKIPLFYGGDGSVTYGTFTWFEAAEIAKAHSKDLISYNEFVAIAYGVLEASSASTADTGITQHLANYTSKFGICMATGCQWIWGKDLHMRPDGTGWAYHTETEGRGSLYAYQYGPTAAIFGGYRDNTVESGSRASVWNNTVWNTFWYFGSRYACDHLELA